MIIYDYQNQNLIDHKLLIFGIILVILGLFCLFILSKYKAEPKEDFSTRILGQSKFQIAEKISELPKISKMMGFMLFIAAGFCIYTQMKNYFYVKNINHFENIKTVSGRLDSVITNNLFGSYNITLHLKDKSFSVAQDSRYVSNRNLLKNDSINIEYFENKFANSMYLEVVKIELK